MKYKLIVSDIDGTLTKIGPENLPSQKVVDAIKRALKQEVVFAMATARPLFHMETFFKSVDFDGYAILDGGASIYHIAKKTYVWETFLHTQVADKIFQIGKTYETEEGIGFSTSEGRINNPEKVLPTQKIKRVNVRGLTNENAEKMISKIHSLNENIIAIKGFNFNNHDLLDVMITNADATKEHAVGTLAEMLHISKDEIIGIGDHYNDLPLLMACGLKVAMGNAVPELKEIADYVAPSLEEDGVVDVINRFVLS